MAQKRPKKRKDGQYHIHKFICTREDGSRYYEWFRGTNWAEVNTRANLFKMEYLAGGHRGEPEDKTPPLTLLGALDKYIDTCRAVQAQDASSYSVSTIAGYMSVRKSLEKHPAFAQIINEPVADLTVDALQTALNAAALPNKDGKALSSKTLRNWYGLLKPTIETYGPEIRLNRIRLAKRKSERTMVISNSSIPAMLSVARTMDDDFFLYILFTAMLGTRPSESYALTWGDVSAQPMTAITGGNVYQYGVVSVDKAMVRDEFGKYREKGTKTESGTRSLSRHWSFFQMLYDVRPRGKDNERIFRMNPNQIPYRWKKLKEQMDLPDGMVLYDLRHYHASAMVACGATDAYIASDMGHADIAITRKHYIEEIAETRQEINAKMFAHTAHVLGNFLPDATKHATRTPKNVDAV